MTSTAGDAPLIVLVHGAWQGAWAWGQVEYSLACRGRASVALDLLAHGLSARAPAAFDRSPLDREAFSREPGLDRGATLADAALLLAQQLRSLRDGSGRKIAVVAHSLGGTVATAAAELAPECVDSLVYVCALTPAGGASVSTQRSADAEQASATASLQVGDPREIGVVRLDLSAQAFPRFHDTFFGDVDAELASTAVHMMSPDLPIRFVADPVRTSQAWAAIKRSYIICTRDKVLPPEVQRLNIDGMDRAAKSSTTNVLYLDASHSPFLSCPGELAGLIDDATVGEVAVKTNTLESLAAR